MSDTAVEFNAVGMSNRLSSTAYSGWVYVPTGTAVVIDEGDEEGGPTEETRLAADDARNGRNMTKAGSLDDLMSRLNG